NRVRLDGRLMEWRMRPATPADSTAIWAIYNEGIADRIATFHGIGEFSVYVQRDYRGHGAGRAVLAALIEAAKAAGLHKLTSRVVPENTASRAHLRSGLPMKFGFVDEHRQIWPVRVMCAALGLSVSGYY